MADMQAGTTEKAVTGLQQKEGGPSESFDFLVLKIKHQYYQQKQINPNIDEQTLRADLEVYAKFVRPKGSGPIPS